ncbi:MAG: RNA methyltransferase substrate-binding domain-containing protein, partial [Calditrichia bacterium]
MPVIFGINPVLEALESKQPFDKIYLQLGKKSPVISKIFKLAKAQKIPVVQADRRKLEQLTEKGKHQGVAALLAPLYYIGLEDLVDKIQK